MAEGILKARWVALGRSDCSVSSMGIHGLDHQPATESARNTCSQHGIDISGHVSRPLIFDELARCDFIFVMELMQKDFLLFIMPQLAGKVFLLGSWPQQDSPKDKIKDPMGGNVKDYRNAYETIARRIEIIVPHLQSLFA